MNNQIKLSEVSTGTTFKIDMLVGHATLTDRLQDIGFTPGCAIKQVVTSWFGGPMTFKLKGAKIAIRKSEADCILVSPA